LSRISRYGSVLASIYSTRRLLCPQSTVAVVLLSKKKSSRDGYDLQPARSVTVAGCHFLRSAAWSLQYAVILRWT